MKFSTVAGIYENIRLGGNKRDALRQIKSGEDACLIYQLFFNDKSKMSSKHITAMFAKEVGVFMEVVLDVLGEDSLAMTLAQESSKSTSQGRTIEQMMGVIETFKSGSISILETTHSMNEIEGRLFWTHILGERVNITPHAYMMNIGMNENIPKDAMKRHVALKEPFSLLHTIFNDPKSLDVPSRWYEETDIALTPRRYKPFLPHQDEKTLMDYNGGVYQRIPQNGKTRMLYVLPEANGTRLVWRDRAGRIDKPNSVPNVNWLPKGPLIMEVSLETDHRTGYTRLGVFDAIFPRYPHLTLQERLDKLHEHLKEHQEDNRLKIEDDDWLYPDAPIIIHSLSGPHKISSIVSWGEDDEVCRFPDLGAFDPFEDGGYILLKSHAKKALRLSEVRKLHDDALQIRLCCIDGVDDFINVVEAEVTGDLKIASQGTVSRLTDIRIDENWACLPDESMIVIEVLAPIIEFDENGVILEDVHVLGLRDDLGISDITQYVDLLHGGE